jgi:hypothetical protein
MPANDSALKIRYFLTALGALFAMGAWLMYDLREMSALRKATSDLSAGIASLETPEKSVSLVKPKQQLASETLDLEKVANHLSQLDQVGGLSEMEELMRFEQRLSQMSRQELLTALHSLVGLKLSPEARLELEKLILASLAALDPAAALRYYTGKLQGIPREIGLQLTDALHEWAKADLASATAWLDQELASGGLESKSLDGQSEMRGQFEAALMGVLVGSDGGAAGRRLESLPEDQRREILEQIPFADLSSQDQQAYVELVRKWLPVDEQPGSFADMGGKLVDGHALPELPGFLDSVNATPIERYAAAKQGAESQLDSLSRDGAVTKEAVDSVRQWVSQQAPEKVDQITGKSLAEAAQNGGKWTSEDAFSLVLDYQRTLKNDDILVAFIEGYAARSNLPVVQPLVLKISDPVRRAPFIR